MATGPVVSLGETLPATIRHFGVSVQFHDRVFPR
jgi:hypothetical protein